MTDTEEFCPLCFAGTESSEHHEKCTSWTDEWIDKGFPWCDDCGAAAVFSEIDGNRHTTRQYPWGVPARADQSGHAVRMRNWSDNGIAQRYATTNPTRRADEIARPDNAEEAGK